MMLPQKCKKPSVCELPQPTVKHMLICLVTETSRELILELQQTLFKKLFIFYFKADFG